MTQVEDSVVARLQLKDEKFEILVDCEKALAFKEGKAVNIADVLVGKEFIFSDSRKGIVVTKKDLTDAFGTTDIYEVAAQIIKKGKVMTTSEHRDKEHDDKLKRIIALIHVNAVDPKTSIPHPPQRIENALKEVKFNVNKNKTADDQLSDAVSAIKKVLPISLQTRQMELKIPANYVNVTFPVIKQMSKIQTQTWQNDALLHMTLEIPAGLRDELIDKINSITHGSVEIKILK